MKIAIISDTHNQIERTRRALMQVREKNVETILHCGDIEDPPIVDLFQGFQAHFVFGNCDWNRDGLLQAMERIGATFHENFGHLEIDGKKLAFLHGHDRELLLDLIQSGAYSYLFHGHTHIADDTMRGETRVINPGALHRVQLKTFAILDPGVGRLETVIVE